MLKKAVIMVAAMAACVWAQPIIWNGAAPILEGPANSSFTVEIRQGATGTLNVSNSWSVTIISDGEVDLGNNTIGVDFTFSGGTATVVNWNAQVTGSAPTVVQLRNTGNGSSSIRFFTVRNVGLIKATGESNIAFGPSIPITVEGTVMATGNGGAAISSTSSQQTGAVVVGTGGTVSATGGTAISAWGGVTINNGGVVSVTTGNAINAQGNIHMSAGSLVIGQNPTYHSAEGLLNKSPVASQNNGFIISYTGGGAHETGSNTGLTAHVASGQVRWGIGDGGVSGIRYGNNFIRIDGVTVNPIKLIMTTPWVTATKEYDGNNTAAATVGGVATNMVAGTVSVKIQSSTYNSKDVATANLITVVYEMEGEPDILVNYDTPDDFTIAGSITEKTLTIKSATHTKEYDGTDAALTGVTVELDGIVEGDDVSPNVITAAYTGRHVGSGLQVTNVTLQGTDAANYTVAPNHYIEVAGITPKALTITGVQATNRSYVYGDINVTLTGGALVGVENIDNAVIGFSRGFGTMDNANAGNNKSVTTDIQLTGNGFGNYTLTQPDVTVDIARAEISSGDIFPPTASEITYGEKLSESELEGGMAGGDWAWHAEDENIVPNVGDPEFRAVFTPIDNDNYDWDAMGDGIFNVALTVNPKTLTITGVAATARAYNGSNTVALTGGTLDGVIDEDEVGINRGNGTMANANVGSGKAVTTNIILSGDAAGNYTLTQPSGITVNITAKELTVTGVAATARAYNGSNTVALTGGTLVGVIDGDEDDIGINRGNGIMTNANVGSGKEVTTNIALSGEAAENYTLTQPSGITVNITAKELTVTGVAATARAYNGSNTVALTGGTLVGVIDGDEDDIGINRGNGTMANANVGSGKEVTTNIALSGEAAGNYTLTQPAGITVNIAKADGEDAPDYTAPATLTAKSDETLADVVGLPEGWKWDADPTTPVGEIGERTHKATFTSADENYETVNEDWTITVDEATSINLGVGSKGSPEARQLASSVQTKYYNLRGQPLGATKPTAPGVYLEKHGKHVRKITIH